MLTLLGSLLGFLSSTFPEFLKLFRDSQDRKHELAILDRQMEQQREYDASMSQRQHEYDTGQANSATQYNNELARTKYLDQWNQAAFLQQKKEEDDMFNAITQRRLNGGVQSPASSFLQRPGSTYNVFGWR